MTGEAATEVRAGRQSRLEALLAARDGADRAFFAAEADRLARLCHRMAERFARGGRLISLGSSPVARSDVRHVAVEFVHPVIVGKRALPAIGLAPEGGELAEQVDAVVEPEDIVFAYADGEQAAEGIAAGLERAGERGCLTVAFAAGAPAEWAFEAPASDPFVAQELTETLYHVLWELVHVFFEHRGLLAGRESAPVHDTGASGFLYPFLGEQEHDLDSVLADVRESVLMKADEVAELRSRTVTENRDVLLAAAADLRARLDAGGKVLAFGNGGSATDAMDLVADLRGPPGGLPARRAIDLTEDPAIITAIANDVGVEAIFQRQVIAYGREGDAAVALSTSGSSRNLIAALTEARARGLATIALVGYDGGRIAAEGLADHVVVTASQHIPRIQEAQASAYHVLRELIEVDEDGG